MPRLFVIVCFSPVARAGSWKAVKAAIRAMKK
jgi:hypothetical protein